MTTETINPIQTRCPACNFPTNGARYHAVCAIQWARAGQYVGSEVHGPTVDLRDPAGRSWTEYAEIAESHPYGRAIGFDDLPVFHIRASNPPGFPRNVGLCGQITDDFNTVTLIDDPKAHIALDAGAFAVAGEDLRRCPSCASAHAAGRSDSLPF